MTRCLALLALCIAQAVHAESVGYRRIEIPDPAIGVTFPVSLWYPAAAPASPQKFGPYTMHVARDAEPADGRFGLVVISHGSGGGALNHRDLGMALAARGYVAAAPMHPRDNFQDSSGVGSVDVWSGRPRQVSRVIDAVLADPVLGPRIRSARVGVAGHSSGGYTALAVAGAKPSMDALVQHCRTAPEDAGFCSFGGPAARAAGQKGGTIPDVHDRRVGALVAMAPHGALFTDEALSSLAVPVRIYGAERDTLTPVRFHAGRLAKVLGPKAEYVLIVGAGHFSFIARFPDELKDVVGEAGQDPAGFDRDRMHETLNREIAEFFERSLQ